MKNQLKYLKLFEGLSPEEIPYSKVWDDGTMSIDVPKHVKKLPPVFNELTDEVTGNLYIIDGNPFITEVTGFNNLTRVGKWLSIENNESLTNITGFNNLTRVYSISIENNESLTNITGFNKLTEIVGKLWIRNNPKLVAMSIPGNLVRSVEYSDYGIYYTNELQFNSPPEFINSPVVIKNLVSKLNPGYHSTQVGIQIWENLKEWGTQATIDKIIARLTPEQLNILPDEFKHLHHPDYKSTSGRDVAKLNTGQIYGIF